MPCDWDIVDSIVETGRLTDGGVRPRENTLAETDDSIFGSCLQMIQLLEYLIRQGPALMWIHLDSGSSYYHYQVVVKQTLAF